MNERGSSESQQWWHSAFHQVAPRGWLCSWSFCVMSSEVPKLSMGQTVMLIYASPSQGGDDPRQNWDLHFAITSAPLFLSLIHPKAALYPSIIPHMATIPLFCVRDGAVLCKEHQAGTLGKVTFLSGSTFPPSWLRLWVSWWLRYPLQSLYITALGNLGWDGALFSDGSLCLFFLQGMDDKSIFRSGTSVF